MLRKIFLLFIGGVLLSVIFISDTVKEVAAGVAILLFGMMMLEKGFKGYVEGPLQTILQRATNTIPKSMGLGFLVTALLQSSSLISVIAISFLSAGLLGLHAGIGVIFGANLGSTVTAWLISLFGLNFKISSLALPMLIFGVIFVSAKSKNLKGLGYILAGLGFFFLGIHFMKEGFEVYRDQINLSSYSLPGFWGLMVYTLIGICITVLLQSSSAAMALILTALAAGQITYHNSLALAIGANIGTTITAVLGALNANRAGKQLAAAHFIFNMVTGVIALVLIVPLGNLVNGISSLLNIDLENYTIKLSVFHSIFNLIGVIVMVPFIDKMVYQLKRMFKDKQVKGSKIESPVYLNETIMAHPQTAIKALKDESKRLFENAAFEIVAHGLNLHRTDIRGSRKLKEVIWGSTQKFDVDVDKLYYEKVKIIYSEIIAYATLAQSHFHLSTDEIEGLSRIKLANRKIVESIKLLLGLRKNVTLFMRSENLYIRDEYNLLRKRVSKVLREIYHLTDNRIPNEQSLVKLEKLKKRAEKSNILDDQRLDHLIRDDKISSTMATSLINDSDTVVDIIILLIEVAEILYTES